MVSDSALAVTLAGILVGGTLFGGIVGAGIDFVTGNQGWWGVCALAGLMIGATVTAVLVEGRGRRNPARTSRER